MHPVLVIVDHPAAEHMDRRVVVVVGVVNGDDVDHTYRVVVVVAVAVVVVVARATIDCYHLLQQYY